MLKLDGCLYYTDITEIQLLIQIMDLEGVCPKQMRQITTQEMLMKTRGRRIKGWLLVFEPEDMIICIRDYYFYLERRGLFKAI